MRLPNDAADADASRDSKKMGEVSLCPEAVATYLVPTLATVATV